LLIPSACSIDEYATHFLLRLVPSLEPIGTIRAHRTPGGYYKLSRLAILAPYRKYGFGRTLVTALNNWVREDAAASGATAAKIVLHSQLPPIKFYEK
jgi:GNAT superfamily N-acetyltransferase